MERSEILIQVLRDAQNDIEQLNWSASDVADRDSEAAKAMMLALWDAQENNTLRMDLWAKDFTVHEMNVFVFQTLWTLADTYHNATGNQVIKAEIKQFAQSFKDMAMEFEKKTVN